MEQPLSLREFVEINEKIIAAFGVFVGLSAALDGLVEKPQGQLLSAGCFAISILLLWEMLNYPPKNSNRTVSATCWVFRFVLVVISFVMGAYLVKSVLTLASANLRTVSIGLVFLPLYVGGRAVIDVVIDLSGLSKKTIGWSRSRMYRPIVNFLLGAFILVLLTISELIVGLIGFGL